MKFKIFKKKSFAIASLILLFAMVALPGVAGADATPSFSLTNCVSSPASCGIYLITVLSNSVAQLLISLATFFVNWGLSITEYGVNLPAVQMGFGITLSLANLGFILGIIVIALSTILHFENYGIKQILWKLVVAAILVNFSLVIAGAILGLSTNITKYFELGTGGAAGFTTSLIKRMAPQQLNQPPVNTNDPQAMQAAIQQCEANQAKITLPGDAGVAASDPCQYDAANLAKIQNAPNADVGAEFNQFSADVLSMIFSNIFNFIIAFTLFALAIMLLIRFGYITILLILMPLAWLCWIFPAFSKHWSKWWSEFIRWTFFPAIVMFFLYIAINTAGNQNIFSTDSSLNQNTDPSGAVATATNTIGTTGVAAQEILLVVLALGGLYAANSMGIAGASVAIGTMKSVGNAVQGYVGKGGRTAGAYAGKQGKKGVSRLVPASAKEKLEAGQYRFAPKRFQSWVGRGLGNVEKAGGGKLVDKEASWAKEKAKDPTEGARLLAGSLNDEQKFALLKEMNSSGKIALVKTVNGKSLDDFRSDEKFFKNAGQGQLLKDLDKQTGHSVMQAKAADAVSDELKKAKPQIDILDKNIDSLKEKREKIDEAWQNASRAFMNNPDAVITDTTGVITTAGTKMKAGEYVELAQKRSNEVGSHQKKAENIKAKTVEEASAKAVFIDQNGATINAKEFVDKEQQRILDGQTKADIGKMALNDIFGKGPRFGLDENAADVLARSFAKVVADKAPQFFGTIIPKLKSEALDKFVGYYGQSLEILKGQATNDARLLELKKREDAYIKAVTFNLSYVEGESGDDEKKEGKTDTSPKTPPAGGEKK